MAQFAGRYNTAAAQDLLARVADVRIGRYADWAVQYELVDIGILKLLSAKIASGGTAGQPLAKQFGQLYSYAIQRYMRGVKDGNLKEPSASQLASVLVETEQQCLSKLLTGPQTGVTRALEAGDMAALQAEHDKLLGGPNQKGALPSKFNFTYGSAQDKRSAPLPLPEPSQRRTATDTPPSEPKPPAKP
jgi:hypothetical protein